MAITLESVAPPRLDQEAVEEEEIVEPAETPAEEIATEEPPAEVVPKARGRPKKRIQPRRLLRKLPQKAAPKPKAKTRAKAVAKKPAPIYESTSESDTPINQDDMDTMLLQFLLQRKHAQRDSRREMWERMAGLS